MLNIFVSHRHEDYPAAATLRDQLQERSGAGTTYFLSEEIRAGARWREELLEALNNSDWFILLFTDPSRDWDWCLFEAGLFQARIDEPGPHQKQKRLICLHHPRVLRPDPLGDYQSVAADKNDTAKLLHEFLQLVNPQWLERNPDKPDEIAETICHAITGKPDNYFYSHTLNYPSLSAHHKRFAAANFEG